MEQIYKNKMQAVGYDQHVCDIFMDWENVKDELLVPERKKGSGNGTIHVFLGAANAELSKEFSQYYASVQNETDAANGAIEITHYFLSSNVVSMLGYVCQYNYEHNCDFTQQVKEVLSYISQTTDANGLLETKSLFKLSTGASKLRPYFKQFESDGVFAKIIRKILLPNSAYKISLYKNGNNEYAAFWLIGFDNLSDFEVDSNIEYFAHLQKAEQTFHQIIYYGAPGTGKSHKIKAQLKDVSKDNIFRTTFHPDSDYSTFVGAYKPTKGKKPLYGLNGGLTVRLNDGKVDLEEDIITYKFIPQAFLSAYIRAYQTNENVFLIIEEINRGNCAQIFGDLFQLLDRDKNGRSEYTIKADADLRAFLEEKMGEDNPGIKDGELCLPPNLFIYATMNTSDQSLFPIDSAFKRRWDWEYEPIKYENKDWVIDIDGLKYSWSDFQKEVNTRILKDTGSEDKMLGDYFVNPSKKSISFNLFRNKILFYLWNDVCKDGDADIFPTSEDFSFSKLYDKDSKQLIVTMMEKLKLKPIDETYTKDNEDGNDMFGNKNENTTSDRYSINGEDTDQNGKSWGKGALVRRAVEIFCQKNPSLSAQDIRDKWTSVGFKIPHIVETENDKQKRLNGSNDKSGRERCKPIKLQNEEVIYVSTEVGNDRVNNNFGDFLAKIKSQQEWGIDIQEL